MYTVDTGSPHPVSHVLFHPSDPTIAVAQPNYGVTLLDRTRGQIVGIIPVPRVADYSSVIFSRGGDYLVIGSARGITVCDPKTLRVILQHGKGALSSAVLADHGADVVAIVRGQLCLLQIRTDSDNYPYLYHFESEIPSRAILTALSPCGCWGVGIYSKARPSLFNIEKGRAAATIDHPYRITEFGMPFPKIIFAPTGRRFAVCDGKDVTVFETQPEEDEDQAEDDLPSPLQSGTTLEAPKPRSVLHSIFQLDRPDQPKQPERWLPQLAFTPDSRGMLIRRPRNRIQLWDVSSNAQMGEWSWRLDSLTCLTVAPDGLTAVAGARFGRVVVWDLE